MWKELKGDVFFDGSQSVSLVDNKDTHLFSGTIVFLNKKGLFRRRDMVRSSYVEVIDDDIVRPTISWAHGMDIYVGFASSQAKTLKESSRQIASANGPYPSIPQEIVQQDIWACKNGKIRGVAWVNHKREREEPISIKPGRSYYPSEESKEEERLKKAYQVAMDELHKNDRERFEKQRKRRKFLHFF